MWGGHPVFLPRTQQGNPCFYRALTGETRPRRPVTRRKRKTTAVRSQRQRLRNTNTICSCISRSQTNRWRCKPLVVRRNVEQRDVLTQLQTTWFYSSALNNATSQLGVYRRYPRVRLHHSSRWHHVNSQGAVNPKLHKTIFFLQYVVTLPSHTWGIPITDVRLFALKTSPAQLNVQWSCERIYSNYNSLTSVTTKQRV